MADNCIANIKMYTICTIFSKIKNNPKSIGYFFML